MSAREPHAANVDRVPISQDPEFTRGHANFPRVGWTIWGLAIATVLAATVGWQADLGVLIVYATLWLPWAGYLLGRRHGTS